MCLSFQDGVISVKDIDLLMSEGLGMRYAFIGPMETMHLNAPAGNIPSLDFIAFALSVSDRKGIRKQEEVKSAHFSFIAGFSSILGLQ